MGYIRKTRSTRSWASISAMACLVATASIGCGGGGGGGDTTPVTTSNVPAGTWGSPNAEVDTASTSSELILDCSSNTLPPIATDSNGNYSFTAEYKNPPTDITNARYTGNVGSTTMTMNVTDPSTQKSLATYTMTLGQTKPPFTGLCTGQ